MRNIVRSIILLSAILGCASSVVHGQQEWRKLIPLYSTCEDVKRLLGVQACTFPVSNYRLTDVSASITFTGKSKKSKVLRVILALNAWIKLEEFESDLTGYTIRPIGDLSESQVYRNDSKGIEFDVTEVEGSKYVASLSLFPQKKAKSR